MSDVYLTYSPRIILSDEDIWLIKRKEFLRMNETTKGTSLFMAFVAPKKLIF